MKKLLIAIVFNFFVSPLEFLAQPTSSKVCDKQVGLDPACTHHVHDNNLNLPSFLTDYVVQSEVSIIVDCENNIAKNRCSGVILTPKSLKTFLG